jgi:hypothetical protein
VNGLLEGMNSKLLGRLKHLCVLGLGEDDYDKMQWEDLPENSAGTVRTFKRTMLTTEPALLNVSC